MADPTTITNPTYTATHVFSTNDVTGTFDGLTQGDILPGDTPVVDFTATPKITKEGVSLYPIDSEFGYYVTDFVGADEKVLDGDYAEGWVGDLTGPAGEQLGLVVSDAPTDVFKTPAVLGTWLTGLGSNTVKASTEHYSVMQNILSDQMYPDDPDAVYNLDDNLILLSQNAAWDGQYVADLLADPETYGVTDKNDDGVLDLRDLMNPNETTIDYDIAYSTDYSVTVKDDGKLLYRWGNAIKKPNDVRLEADMPLPDEWDEADPGTGLMPLYKITGAELVTNHTITNNPNDQIRPEDFENEAAIGKLPTYQIIPDYNVDGNGPREVWVTTDDYYAGDGTLYPAGTILKDEYLAQLASESDLSSLGADSADLQEGFTNAWYTTMDREPFEAAMDGNGDYISGPRWRLQPDKYGQDLPGVQIPIDPSDPLPITSDEVKYEVGADDTTVINLLDWGLPVSPLSISAGWQNNSDSVSVNGLNMTTGFDVAFYIKGDIKPATVYDTTLLMEYEEIPIADPNTAVIGTASSDHLVGQGGNVFNGGAGSDLFVVSYGKSEGDVFKSSTIQDFTVGEDVLGLIDLGVYIDDTGGNFDVRVTQTVVNGSLRILVDGMQIAQLNGVTEALSYDDFLTLNREPIIPGEGTSGDDLLVGDATDDVLDGMEGNDTALGQSGQDDLMGGADNDELLAEPVNEVFDDASEDVFRLFQTTLDRLPAMAGQFVFTKSLISGAVDLAALANVMISSAEFTTKYGTLTNEEFVVQLFDNALDRAPTPSGLATYVAALDSSTLTRAELAVDIATSAEGVDKTSAVSLEFSQAGYQQAYTDEAYRLYVATQGIDPSVRAMENLTLDLANGESMLSVVNDLMTTDMSMDLYDGTTNAEFVELLFETALDRAVNPTGLASYTNALDNNILSRADLILAVAQSTEAQTNLVDDLVMHMKDLGQDDQMDGGADDDVLFGGILSDTFMFDVAAPGADEVVGIEAWDMLEFTGFGYASAADALAKMTQIGEDVVFDDQGVTITHLNTQLTDISADMILV